MACVMCVSITEGIVVGDGCDLALTLCRYTLRKVDLFVLSWARVTNEVGKCLFRVANVWWKCAQYLLLWLDAYSQ